MMKYSKASKFLKWSLQVLAGLVLLSGVASAGAIAAIQVDKTQPYEMMKAVSEHTFSRLKAERETIQADPQVLKAIVEEELMPFVNYRYAALKVLGTSLKGAKRQDVETFVDAFHKYLVTSYAQVLTLYTDQTVEFEPERPVPKGKRITSVKLDVIDPPRPNVKLEFKLRKNKKSGEWLAFDMVAEGISLLSSKQSEWKGKIRKEGIAAVSQDLYKLADNPIRFEGEQE